MVHVSPHRFTSFEYRNKVCKVDIESGHTLEQMLEPAYWAHVANKLQDGDEIVAVAEDNTFRAHFYVIERGPNWANVYCLKFDELTKEFQIPVTADQNYLVQFGGNLHKWRVKRKSDGQVLISKLKTPEQATDWLRNYKATLARDAKHAV